MSERRNVSTGSPYEPIVGISRAVRIGSVIAVAGTAPLGQDGTTVAVGDAAAQARRCFESRARRSSNSAEPCATSFAHASC
jgi:enamine deaminase RidA (YjgF/YER057c/UK114 family)